MINDIYIETERTYKGYDYVIALFYLTGCRYGYVFCDEKDPSQIKDIICHGGITFNGIATNIGYDKHAIGFNCAYAWDKPDIEACLKVFGRVSEGVRLRDKFCSSNPRYLNYEIKNLDYCIAECEEIIDQLIEMHEDKEK